MIKNGIWRPGDRIPTLQNLSHMFDVSISTLREVLRSLESRHILSIEQGRGIFVRTDVAATSINEELNSASLKELFEARRLLEPELAFMAAQRGFMDEIDAIGQTAEQMSNLVKHRQNFTESDIRFHALIAKASHNDILFRMFQTMEVQIKQGRQYTNMIPGMIDKAVHYHLMIAKSLANRNAESAESLMRSHVEDMMSYVLSMMKQAPVI
jgi:GntR family transcriptional regulator, transcriptional repressor for pyruvate dehydrogenase complex